MNSNNQLGPGGGGGAGMEPPPLEYHPAKKDSLYMRIFRSRRVRLFFVISILLHVIGAVLISTKTIHDLLLGVDDKPRDMEATPWELQSAINTLTQIYSKRFVASVRELSEIRAQLDNLQLAKQMRLKQEDKDRKEKIDRGEWPTKERPDKHAKFQASIDTDPPRFNFEPLPELEKMALVPLYRLHAPIEIDIGRVYERFSALDLTEPAKDDPIPLSQALRNTKLTHPRRRDIQENLLDVSRIKSSLGEPFKQFKQELIDAYLETQDMVNTSKRWLEIAQGKDPGMGPDTKFGPSFNVVPPPQPYYGHYLNPRLLRRATQEQIMDQKDLKLVLDNRIGEGDVTLAADWIGINRWYTIGPFHHPGAKRRLSDLERKYPPETRVDLDANYEGKGDRKLTWKYRVIGTDFLEKGIRLEPYTLDNESYAIWYFYSEVWSSKEQNVVASFASDDYGVCWLNKERVYQSPPDTQPWVPFTRYGFRVLRMRKGWNQILFKLENATGSTAFSVIMMTHEDKDLIAAVREGIN